MISKLTSRIITRFILINTFENENIGSSARALKTMGFSCLSLVNPRDTKVLNRHKTIQRASGATDILENAKLYTTVEDAIKGCDMVIGTGMPIDMYQKRTRREYTEPRLYFEQLLNDIQCEKEASYIQEGPLLDVAFLFGCETTGMAEEDMDKCLVMLGILTNPKFGSLNLASAVQIIAYDWRMALGGGDSYG